MPRSRGAATQRGRRAFFRAFLAVAAALSLLLCAAQPSSAAGKKPEEFAKGITEQDHEQWPASEKLMREAIAKDAEDGKPVRIYGTRYLNYLPHYYLGLALYKQGKCAAALAEWETCLKLGAVQRTPEFAALSDHRIECQKLALYQPKP
jgi:hypothetical protein